MRRRRRWTAELSAELRLPKILNFVLCAAAVLASQRSTPAEDYRAALIEGDQASHRLDEAAARSAYERAHRLAPQDFEALEKLTQACIDLGNQLVEERSKEAETYFREAIQYAEVMRRQFPSRAQSYFYLAASYGSLSLLKGGRQKIMLGREVEGYAEKAIALDPNYAPPYAVLGVFYREVASLNWLERALAESLYGHLPKVTLDDARKMLVKAVALDPTSVYARYQLALTYEMAGDRAEEVKTLGEIARLAPRNRLELRFQGEAQRKLQQLRG